MPEPAPGKPVPGVSVRSLTCPNCGATVTVRSFGQAVNVVCGSCHSILDAQDPKVQVLQQFKAAIKYEPLIPPGTRGKLRGVLYELVGCQRRAIEVDGISYSWSEYVLFNPYKGFRYLTEFDGHWNYVSVLRSLPDSPGSPGSEAPVRYLGETYRHFQSAQAKTSFVIGEFPWQVRVGEAVDVTDYVSPPRVLSSETTKDKEVTWSMGEYMTGVDIWKTFSLPGTPPPPTGVFENQPSPFASTPKIIWKYCGIFLIVALLLLIVHGVMAKDKEVFRHTYEFSPGSAGEHSFVTDTFELSGHAAPVKVETTTDLDNAWIYLDYALINQDTGQAYDFGREISSYYGSDEDGSWSEGSQHDSILIPAIPPGHYYLRIEPESDPGRPISYTVSVTHDAPVYWWFLVAAALLVVPALFATWRSMSFEHMRWQESDHAGGSGGSSNDSSGDDDDS
ncbi:MAG TPA: DUF4178 domain-containing protein [Verrucomicrobiae bacterium]|jgi:hypothetical protein|nr:DUF4178 domain-containing protein [Verrucomicrobiae bacterium]